MPSRVLPHRPAVVARGYHDTIVEHYENPRNVGSLDKNDASVGTVRCLRGSPFLLSPFLLLLLLCWIIVGLILRMAGIKWLKVD